MTDPNPSDVGARDDSAEATSNDRHPEPANTGVMQSAEPPKRSKVGFIMVAVVIIAGAGWILFELQRDWFEAQFKAINAPELVSVSGKLTYNGRPVDSGFVETRLIRANGKELLGGLGKINEDGSFKLLTDIDGKLEDGIVAGKHKMVVKSSKIEPGQLAATWLVPLDYVEFSTTPIEFETTVDRGQMNLEFDLKDSE